MTPTTTDDAPRWRTGYASGAFDLLHAGHVRYLCAAADRCERLLVGIPNDAIVTRSKGHPPATPAASRLEVVAALRCVARALPVSVAMDDTAAFAEFLKTLAVDVALIGAEWAETPRWHRLRPALECIGIAVVFLPRTDGISTSEIVRRLTDSGS